jgi:ATP phosphoribosyltransferase regulatory subunit
MSNILSVPQGLKDYLVGESKYKSDTECGIMDVILGKGYRRIETPIIEYMDVFTQAGAFSQEDMFKLSDNKGSALVLRPDMTIPAARLAATRFIDYEILKLCYIGQVFHFKRVNSWELKEVTQIGIEYMGEDKTLADSEVIDSAYECVKSTGLSNFQIDLGQVDFYNGLMEEAGITDENAVKLSKFVEQKDTLAIEILLQQIGVSGAAKNLLMNLPLLFGGLDALERAKKYTENAKCRAAVENISEIVDGVNDEVRENISVDFSMVQSVHIYTGMIFQGITDRLGTPIITGGRYDSLTSCFGRKMPATGFALDGNALLTALDERSGK